MLLSLVWLPRTRMKKAGSAVRSLEVGGECWGRCWDSRCLLTYHQAIIKERSDL